VLVPLLADEVLGTLLPLILLLYLVVNLIHHTIHFNHRWKIIKSVVDYLRLIQDESLLLFLLLPRTVVVLILLVVVLTSFIHFTHLLSH
jgi:hypothetical protein